ncbi:MAG: ROK family transcriptional regulator [Rhodobacterales bacterium]|nr:ROK family transcriptional regulator [Rhodobacterales bacterium]
MDPIGGANQSRLRAYNERLVLSIIRRQGGIAKSELARRTRLTAQSMSVIIRSLEKDGLLLRGEPQRGKVGQPSIPMLLNPDGVFTIGLEVERRRVDLVLMDFQGEIRQSLHETYTHPRPSDILAFVRSGLKELIGILPLSKRTRIAGIGVAMPFELWSWLEKVGAPHGEMEEWRNFDMKSELGELCVFPVFIQNDATAACGAELVFGRGSEFDDFVYFFIGSFIGGGVVLNHNVFPGRSGNAGALGSMPVIGADGKPAQLIEQASIYVLENMLREKGIDPSPLWLRPDEWDDFGDCLEVWITGISKHLAMAIVASCSVIDFRAAIIDGAFPVDVRKRIVDATVAALAELDLQGVNTPMILPGEVGNGARVIGGASLPLFVHYLLDQNILFKEAL